MEAAQTSTQSQAPQEHTTEENSESTASHHNTITSDKNNTQAKAIDTTFRIRILGDANISMSTCPRSVAAELNLTLFEWPSPRVVLTDTGLMVRSTHFTCLHDIFGSATAILDDHTQQHIVLSIREANLSGFKITFHHIRDEVQIHNNQTP
jgi:hypothetical protein